ncbi:MAG: Indole-3-pyruvate decarboxylase [Chlamydiae bacterium]|nr:Indole-3-pyruvate decarboxylase [Chlamydiota bacterium]
MAVQTKTKAKTTTIGKYLLDRLHAHGVEHIFGLPGDYILRFDKLIEDHPIKLINATRENTAGYMADGYARLRGLGVACVTYGVGINITNAVSQAFVESSPLVVISGAAGIEEYQISPKLHHLYNGEGLERDNTQLEIFQKITVAQAVLDNPATAAQEIDRAIEACLEHKKPVYIEFPRDQVDATIPLPHPEPFQREASDPEALREVLREVQKILKNCNRPVIWVGHEIQRYGLADAVLRFAEKYHIPIVSSLLGKSTISEYHPLYVGLYQGELSREEVRDFVENCDCAILLGVNLNDVNTGIFSAVLEQENKIISTSSSTEINHHLYKEVLFSDFVGSLCGLELNICFRFDHPACIDRSFPDFAAKKGKKITASRVYECIQKHLKPEHIIVSDFGDCLFGSADLLVEQNSYLSNSYFAALGFGVPATIGAQFALPKKRVIGLVGDGAFQMTCMELSTAVRYNIDPVIILINNHGYATERPILEGEFNELVDWKYSEIPKVLQKGVGIHVETEDEFDKALAKAFSTRGEYFIIEVELDKTDYSPGLKRFCKLINIKGKSS